MYKYLIIFKGLVIHAIVVVTDDFFIIIVIVVIVIAVFLVIVIQLIEHELLLVLHQELRAPLDIDEKRVNPLDILDSDLGGLPLGGAKARCDNHVDGVTEGCLHTDSGEKV